MVRQWQEAERLAALAVIDGGAGGRSRRAASVYSKPYNEEPDDDDDDLAIASSLEKSEHVKKFNGP